MRLNDLLRISQPITLPTPVRAQKPDAEAR